MTVHKSIRALLEHYTTFLKDEDTMGLDELSTSGIVDEYMAQGTIVLNRIDPPDDTKPSADPLGIHPPVPGEYIKARAEIDAEQFDPMPAVRAVEAIVLDSDRAPSQRLEAFDCLVQSGWARL